MVSVSVFPWVPLHLQIVGWNATPVLSREEDCSICTVIVEIKMLSLFPQGRRSVKVGNRGLDWSVCVFP